MLQVDFGVMKKGPDISLSYFLLQRKKGYRNLAGKPGKGITHPSYSPRGSPVLLKEDVARAGT